MRDCGCKNGSHWSLLEAVVAAFNDQRLDEEQACTLLGGERG